MSLPRLLSRICTVAIVLWLASVGHAQSADVKTKPTGSISGRITVSGKPGGGIDVGAFGGDNSANRRIPAAQTRTDTEGYYRLSGLAAGHYQVTTFTSNLTSAETNSDPYGSVYFNSGKGVLLAAGEEVNDLDIKLARGGVISGRVTDADNKPVIEERISVQPVVDPNNPRSTRPPAPITPMYLTDDRGMYRIYGLPEGRYRVSVGRGTQGGMASASGFYPLTYHPDVTDPGRATIIDLSEGGEATNVDIHVGRRQDTYAITGHVVDSETGLPVAGARIGLMVTSGDQSYASGTIGNQTAADGKFTVPAVTAGHYGVYVSSDYDQNDYYSDPVHVDVSDNDVSGVEVKAIRGLTISGTVVAETGDLRDLLRQLPALRVSANVVPPGGRILPSTIRSFGAGTVAADGSFTITGLRPGHAMIGVSSTAPNTRPAISKVSVGGVGVTQGFDIENQSVNGVTVLLSYGNGVIRGMLTFQGGALANFRPEIICRRDGAGSYAGGATLDARGHFEMLGIPPGTYDCGVQLIRLPGASPERPPQIPHQSITVANGAEAQLNFLIDFTPKGVGP